MAIPAIPGLPHPMDLLASVAMLHTMLTLALSSATPATPATPAQTAVAWVAKLATTVRATSSKNLVPLATELFVGQPQLSVTGELVHAVRHSTTQSASASPSK